MGGTAVPAVQVLWSRWAPPNERGKLLGFSFAGMQVGNIITLPLAALLCEYGFDNGWGSIFYVYGILGLIWFAFWVYFCADQPSLHPRISKEELEYLKNALDGTLTLHEDKKSMKTPWFSMLKSGPVWALVVMNVASDWGAYSLLTNIPTYLRDVLKFDLKSNGIFSAIPYIFFAAFINVFGVACDALVKTEKLSVKNARKLFSAIGMIPPALFLVATGYVDCTNSIWAIVLLTMAQAFSGAQFGGGFFCNHIDIAPDFAGVIMGISNSVGAVAGVLAPLLIGLIVKSGTEGEWRLVFYVCAIIMILGTLVYLFLADGVVQEWAKPKGKGDDETGLPLVTKITIDDKDDANEREKKNYLSNEI